MSMQELRKHIDLFEIYDSFPYEMDTYNDELKVQSMVIHAINKLEELEKKIRSTSTQNQKEIDETVRLKTDVNNPKASPSDTSKSTQKEKKE